MVNGGLILWVIIFTERRRHQAADKKMPALTILAEADTQITLIVCERGQEPSVRVFEAFYAPHIADEVFSFIALYSSPFLVRKIWYSVYGYHHPIHKTNRTRIYAREAVRLDSRPEQGRDIQRTILHYSLRNREGRLTKFDKKVFSH